MNNQFRRLETEVLFKPKLRIYKELKDNFSQPKPYTTLDINRKTRSLILQFRSGSLLLAIETGRWHNIDREYIDFVKFVIKPALKMNSILFLNANPLSGSEKNIQNPFIITLKIMRTKPHNSSVLCQQTPLQYLPNSCRIYSTTDEI